MTPLRTLPADSTPLTQQQTGNTTRCPTFRREKQQLDGTARVVLLTTSPHPPLRPPSAAAAASVTAFAAVAMGCGSSCCDADGVHQVDGFFETMNTYAVHNLTTRKLVVSVYYKAIVGSKAPTRAMGLLEVGPQERALFNKPPLKAGYLRKGVVVDPERLNQTAARLLPRVLTKEAWSRDWDDQSHTMDLELQHALVVFEFRDQPHTPLRLRLTNPPGYLAWKAAAPIARGWDATREAFKRELREELSEDWPPYRYAKRQAYVRYGSDLCDPEQDFLNKRLERVRQAMGKFLGMDLSAVPLDCIPRIGIAASGGGYRAMLATLGTLIEFESAGLLDCCTYISGVSGGSWLLANMYASPHESMRALKAHLVARVGRPFYDLDVGVAMDELKERLAGTAELSLIDEYSWFLSAHMFQRLETRKELWSKPRLSEQGDRVFQGQAPLPLYTAVQSQPSSGPSGGSGGDDASRPHYRWMEATPFEVGIRDDVCAFVPAWSFGRRFREGVSVCQSAEPSLALLAGVCGSAFCASVDQIAAELCSEKVGRVVHAFLHNDLGLEGEDRLFSPAKFHNWAHRGPLAGEASLSILDAGCDNNIPFAPLLRPERQVDVIIACDQSAGHDQLVSANLLRAAEYARKHRFPFPDVSQAVRIEKRVRDSNSHDRRPKKSESVASLRPVTLCHGDVAKGVPSVLYMPLLRNDAYSPSFDPRTADFCSTTNWVYTPEQVDLLTGLTAANARQSVAQIKAELRATLQKKRDLDGAGNGRRLAARALANIGAVAPAPDASPTVQGSPPAHGHTNSEAWGLAVSPSPPPNAASSAVESIHIEAVSSIKVKTTTAGAPLVEQTTMAPPGQMPAGR